MKKDSVNFFVFGMILVAAVGLVFSRDSIPQPLDYHNFADDRTIFGIVNFWNVFSNIPFLVIGLFGVYSLYQNKSKLELPGLFYSYLLFFVGIFLVGLGSAYYHWNPTNETLVWDRLPMTIAFMPFFSSIISIYISEKWGRYLFIPLIVIGISSVLYWSYTETIGKGDLRPYLLVQFLPIALIPFILLLFKRHTKMSIYIWAVLLCYVIAKVFEVLDLQVFNAITVFSGHTIKHFFSEIAALVFLMGIKQDRRANE